MVLLTNENKKSVRVEFLDKLISSLEEDKFEQNFKEIKENFSVISIYNNSFNENNPLGFIARDLDSGKIKSFDDLFKSFKVLSDLISETEVKKLCIKLFGNDKIFEKIDFFQREYPTFLRERKVLDSILFSFGVIDDGARRIIYSHLGLDTNDPDAREAEQHLSKLFTLLRDKSPSDFYNIKDDFKKFFFSHPQNSKRLEFKLEVYFDFSDGKIYLNRYFNFDGSVIKTHRLKLGSIIINKELIDEFRKKSTDELFKLFEEKIQKIVKEAYEKYSFLSPDEKEKYQSLGSMINDIQLLEEDLIDEVVKEEFSKLFDFDDFQRELVTESIKRVYGKN